MAKIITGTFLGYTEETREYNDKQSGERKSFVSRQMHVLDGFSSERLELGRDLADLVQAGNVSLPPQNSEVWVEVSPRVSGSRVYWTAVGILDSVPASKAS